MTRFLDLRLAALLGSAGSAWASPLGEPRFNIQALGDRCWDLAEPREGGDGRITIQPCDRSESQMFRIQELDATHDFQILTLSGTGCVGIVGATGAALVPGQSLALQSCSPTPGRRFAFDGDALLVGTQGRNERVSRNFVLEPLAANTNAGTPVVVGVREVNDAEYWRILPVDGSDIRPHSGFVQVATEQELFNKLRGASWGDVIELVPTVGSSISLGSIPLPLRIPDGVTLRGGRKFLDNGVELLLPTSRPLSEVTVLEPRNYARITALRLTGHDIPEEDENPATTYGVQIGTGLEDDPAVADVIVDHIEVSHWSDTAIVLFGPHRPGPVPGVGLPNEDCPAAREEGHLNYVIGNFIHHNLRDYGVMVVGGAQAKLQGNLMFLNSHDVTSAFYNGANQYFVLDGLFTSEDSDYGTSALLDVHGSCDSGHWNGGRGGDLFEAAFNSFFTDRGPVVSVRGTPCDHFGFHDNLTTQPENADSVNVEPGEPGDLSCSDGHGGVFEPGLPEDILVMQNNTFDAVSPLASCGGTRADLDAPCSTGNLGVGDFDGDGTDDLFVGTGVTWWFSSGGAAEWRFLNRMPELASELRFGDFDRDGRTDIVAVHGSTVRVSWAGGSPWFTLNTLESGLTIADLAVGQFDADLRADLFAADGDLWTFSSGGSSSWAFFADEDRKTSKLLFGHFVGDSRTDVFGVVDGLWQVIDGPGGDWEVLSDPWPGLGLVEEAVAADFNGNGVADIAYYLRSTWDHPAYWMVSWSGTTPLELWLEERQPLFDLPIGNFDSDPGADVLLWSNERWLNISSGLSDEFEPWSRQSMR